MAKAAEIRTASFPPCSSAASPNAVVRPLRATDVRTAAGPTAPGRRKNAEITIGSGNGTTAWSARAQIATMYPPLIAPPVPSHRPVSSAANTPPSGEPEGPDAVMLVSASNAYSSTAGPLTRAGSGSRDHPR